MELHTSHAAQGSLPLKTCRALTDTLPCPAACCVHWPLPLIQWAVAGCCGLRAAGCGLRLAGCCLPWAIFRLENNGCDGSSLMHPGHCCSIALILHPPNTCQGTQPLSQPLSLCHCCLALDYLKPDDTAWHLNTQTISASSSSPAAPATTPTTTTTTTTSTTTTTTPTLSFQLANHHTNTLSSPFPPLSSHQHLLPSPLFPLAL